MDIQPEGTANEVINESAGPTYEDILKQKQWKQKFMTTRAIQNKRMHEIRTVALLHPGEISSVRPYNSVNVVEYIVTVKQALWWSTISDLSKVGFDITRAELINGRLKVHLEKLVKEKVDELEGECVCFNADEWELEEKSKSATQGV